VEGKGLDDVTECDKVVPLCGGVLRARCCPLAVGLQCNIALYLRWLVVPLDPLYAWQATGWWLLLRTFLACRCYCYCYLRALMPLSHRLVLCHRWRRICATPSTRPS
jgi:hypothetical protein